MTILAKPKLFFTHAVETYLIGGLIIFLIGLVAGWLLWRHARAHAERVQKLNQILRERHNALIENREKVTALVDELPENPSL